MDDYLKVEFGKILHSADAIEILTDEDGKRRALADLANEYELRAKKAHHVRHGALILRSPEGSDYSVLSRVLQAQTSGTSVVEAVYNIRETVHKATTMSPWHVTPGTSPLEYILGPYDYVNNKYAYEARVIREGSILLNAPTLDYDFEACHQPIIRDGVYHGINTETYVINNDRNCTPVYEMFEMMASAVLQYMAFSTDSNLKKEAMDLYSKTWETDFDERLYMQAMVGGLSYDTPYYDWVSIMPELDSTDDENLALWSQHIAKILKS
mgnify:CR=1 FL=1